MPIEVEAPDGKIVEFPAETSVETIKTAMAKAYPTPKPETWGEYAKGLGRTAANSALFNFGGELGLIDEAKQHEFESRHPIASTVAGVAGGLPLLAAGPGAAAARWALGGRTLLRTMGRSALLGGGLGAASGAGASEGGPAERLEGAATGAVAGGTLGAAIPPVVAAAGGVVRAVAPAVNFLARRRPAEPILPFDARSDPIRGAQFVADGAPPPSPGEVASAQERAVLAVRDAMLRGGVNPEQAQAELAGARSAAKPHSTGQAQTVTVPADINPALTRLAGVFARQSPEAAQEMSQVMQARQTGITPAGASQEALAQRGIPSVARLGEPMTGQQAQTRFGTHFGAGLANEVPIGSRSRIKDWLERFFLIKDKKFHGFGATGIETMEQVAARADAMSKANYDAARKAHAFDNFRKQVDDVFKAALDEAAAKEAPTVEKVIEKAHELFRPGKPINLEQFDNTKRVLDNRIKALLDDPDTVHAGGLLNEVKNKLLAAVDDATGGEKSLYATARNAHSGAMQDMRAYLAGRNVLTENEALRRTGPLADLIADESAAIRHFQMLDIERQRLWRQGFTDAVVAKLPRNVNRSGLQIFNEDRVQRLLRETAPAESANRAELLGRYIDFEGRMPETRHVSTGNSLTAMRVQDDLMAIATEASQNVRGVMDVLRGNTSLYQLGERLMTLAWDRAFGIGADAAREGTRFLFTANPAEQEAFLREVARRWPANRMAHFNQLMEEAQRYLASSATMAGGAAGAPVPAAQRPQPDAPSFV